MGPITVGVAPDPPYISCLDCNGKVEGFAWEFLSILLQTLGNSEVEVHRFPDVDKLYAAVSTQNPSLNITANFYIGSYLKFQEIRYAMPISFHSRVWITKIPEPERPHFLIFKPFHPDSWFLLSLSLLLIFGTLTTLKIRFFLRSDRGWADPFRVFAGMAGHDSLTDQAGRSFAFLGILFLFADIVFKAIYSALILNALLKSNIIQIPFRFINRIGPLNGFYCRSTEELEKLVRTGEKSVVSYYGPQSSVFRLIRSAEEGSPLKAFYRAITANPPIFARKEDLMEELRKNGSLVGLASTVSAPAMFKRVPCEFIVIRENLLSFQWQSYIFPRNTSDEIFEKLYQTLPFAFSLLNRLLHKYNSIHGETCLVVGEERVSTGILRPRKEDRERPLGFTDTKDAFVLCATGISVAIAGFIAEISVGNRGYSYSFTG